MAAKKWLNIVVDGNSAMAPYWPKIVSEYLQNIIRTFFHNSTEKGANETQCELGLVMYNANSNTGLNVQYVDWTGDVNYFLGILSCLPFNGDNLNPHVMVEGLAEALVMFPRPSNVMTTEEYYNGERHCVVIPARDPFPRRMLVSVPEINEGRITGRQVQNVNADFYEVAEMFGPLAVSLSIISPKQHPIFEVIFNMGNGGSPLAITPISNIIIDQFTVLLSANFKEAHDALGGKRTVDPSTTESRKRTNDIRFPINFANHQQEGEGSSKRLVVEERGNRGVLGGISGNWSTFPPSTRNSLNIQPYSSPLMLPHATNRGGGGGHQHFPLQVTRSGPFGGVSLGPSTRAPPPFATQQFNPSHALSPPPYLTNFQHYSHAWEGSLVGNIHKNRKFLHTAKALKRATSPLTLTNEWSSKLEIILYLSEKAVNHTIKLYYEPVDYVFFTIMQFNNVDLYNYLRNKNLCAKIRLPTQTLILSPTESKHHFIGSIFNGDTIFFEPL